MWKTVLTIEHEYWGIPVFGIGWALGIWLVVWSITLLAAIRRQGWGKHLWASLPSLLLPTVLIIWVAPVLEEHVLMPAGDALPAGLKIRGYGLMLLFAIVAGVGLSMRRARQIGFDPDQVVSLAMAMLVTGIVGARLFFVIQKWDEFRDDRWVDVLTGIFNITQGGLVVYGSFLGAMLAVLYFCQRHRLSPLFVGDLIAPGMMLGLAIGRIGCLLNGCCYGGECPYPWAIAFPPDSPPYVEQQRMGRLHGIRLESDPQGGVRVADVDAQSPAARAGLRVGDQISAIDARTLRTADDSENGTAWERAQSILMNAGAVVAVDLPDGRQITWDVKQLPARSAPIHPTQIYSSINALLISLLLWFYFPYRYRQGAVLALMLTLYPPSRFLLEVIRIDEGEVGVTGMTISQNVSVLLLLAGVGLWIYLKTQPKSART